MESEPPETEISERLKSDEGSERTKERIALSPDFRDETSELMAMVGMTVSTDRLTELLSSEPSLLVLPAASEKAEEATEITALLLLLAFLLLHLPFNHCIGIFLQNAYHIRPYYLLGWICGGVYSRLFLSLDLGYLAPFSTI